MAGLFGEEFEIKIEPKKDKTKKLIEKLKEPKKSESTPVEKLLKSKKLTLQERLDIIKTKVLQILGKQKDNVIVIRDLKTFENYISKAIEKGVIAIDTETNNSLDPVTCKLMGPCLYVPGEKQAYIPINHIDNESGERLANQLTEQDCAAQFRRLLEAKTYILMHNGKFDYEVIKCTCGVEIAPNWDTMVAARILDENELASLKAQYTTKIDPDQKKYDIEDLFANVLYEQVDPEIFALYAATDSMMTYKLWEYQKPLFEGENNKKLKWLFEEIEMPIVKVTAEMELAGVEVDVDFGERLKTKYNNQLAAIDEKISNILVDIKQILADWRLTEEANAQAKQYEPKKTKKSRAEIELAYPLIDEKLNKRYKLGKRLVDQLEDPINLASPIQLAILFYDVLGCGTLFKKRSKTDRGTGEEQLETIIEQVTLKEASAPKQTSSLLKLSVAKNLSAAILERRGIVKLITTYIEVIPDLAKHWPDGRIRFHLNANGTDTGRYSSGGKLKFVENGEPVVVSGINIQNIPSHNKDIRMLFIAKRDFGKIEMTEDFIVLPEITEIETIDGWRYGKDLSVGDSLVFDDGIDTLKNISYNSSEKCYYLYV